MSIEARTTGLRLGAIGIGLLLAAAFVGSAAVADLKIGFTLSLTGGTDDYGKGARMGAELALKEYNDKGGYKGQKVEAVIYDDETKPAKGVENVTRQLEAIQDLFQNDGFRDRWRMQGADVGTGQGAGFQTGRMRLVHDGSWSDE